MSRDAVLTPLAQLREQWQESRVVRLGAWLGAALLSLYVVLAGFDAVDAMTERNGGLAAELTRLNALSKETQWPERSRDVAGLKAAYEVAVWSDADIALTEAGLQDWLRSSTQRLGLKVREINLVRTEQQAAEGTANVPAGYVELHARVSVELQRTPLFALLAEMGNQERRVVVERVSLRSQSQPATAEIDLRVLARPGNKP
ncbi:GspMb/PilO family protein [Roseateles asaccharophilus]|uniref:Type II secretory pathway component PulM n=1 Tax=Roseateles asaccharophilus TaxID=582607 RepID=A0ABU2ABX7_9BURK|nr:GspMb/PilO family protein [Roseateles asaccharophilus]MDR7334714.1 type II secretory pathway component PulM [Roseateles asaccharophilus]